MLCVASTYLDFFHVRVVGFDLALGAIAFGVEATGWIGLNPTYPSACRRRVIYTCAGHLEVANGVAAAVEEQSSGLYAQHMAERGFMALAFDPSFTGESGGEPRRMASPDINTEDFLAAVDFLSVQPNVDPERIGIIGICGWGGMAVYAAALDHRIKATVASSRVNTEGYFESENTPA